MIFSIIFATIISIIFIVSIHYVYIFLKENLTTPKIKDLVNKPAEQYNNIYKDLEKEKKNNTSVDMKGELQNYLKSLNNSKNQDNQDNQENQAAVPEQFSFANDTNGLNYQSL